MALFKAVVSLIHEENGDTKVMHKAMNLEILYLVTKAVSKLDSDVQCHHNGVS